MTATTSRRGSWLALWASCMAFAGLYAWAYPPLSGIEDEVGFVNQTLVWSRGAISFEGADLAPTVATEEVDLQARLMDFVRVGRVHRPGRHPGRSLILLPFLVLGGLRAGFISGLAIHLAVVLIGGQLLARLGRSPLWAVLLLFHPTLAIYSRTIMGDEAAGGLILLAALCATRPGRRWAVAAGLAAGAAALMRYHAGLALPIVAGSIAIDPGRERRRGDGVACMVAGGLIGAAIVAYNLTFYGAALDPVGGPRGQFGLGFVPSNLPFYAGALMTLWPAMLVAPALDRSRIGTIARGVALTFTSFFLLYYFHDRGSSPIETAVLGLRLIQPALPIWIVSYALVVDDRLARPLRARLGPRVVAALGAAIAVGLLGATSLLFAKHQAYLNSLLATREAIVERIPPGSLVVSLGAPYKLFGIADGGPAYRWRVLVVDGVTQDYSSDIERCDGPWYLAILVKADRALPTPAKALIARHGMWPVANDSPSLLLYRADPSRRPPPTITGPP